MLNHRDAELVTIGAAVASNCLPCIEDHLAKAQQAGLSTDEVLAAVRLAEKVKQATSSKVSDTTLTLLGREDPIMEFLTG